MHDLETEKGEFKELLNIQDARLSFHIYHQVATPFHALRNILYAQKYSHQVLYEFYQ